jgi:ceramide glucosyltransferase
LLDWRLIAHLLPLLAICPFVYYALVLFSAWRFFRAKRPALQSDVRPDFTPPVSNLQPIRGLDPEAYENLASLCRQDYPEYELLFCVNSPDDEAVPFIETLAREFPQRRIRLLVGFGDRGNRQGTNDKTMKLSHLVREARHEVLVINDSDVRVTPDYLRTIVAPLADPSVGAVTCFYANTESSFPDRMQTVGLMSDFYAGLIVARQLDGVKFALGTTIVTTRTRLAEFGGYESLENRPADDMLVGRLIAERGYTVELLPYTIEVVADYKSLKDLFRQRLRWLVVMRYMRPWGHFGLVFTHGIAWCALATALHPTLATALGWFGAYLLFRMLMLWSIGIQGLKRHRLWGKVPLVPLWDLFALTLWLTSFTRHSIRWRDGEYSIRDGQLKPVAPNEE